MYQVDIVEEPTRRVVGVEHRGPYDGIGPAFERLMQIVDDQRLQDEMVEFLGVYFDDPRSVPEADLHALAAIRVREDLPLPEGLVQARLPAGRYARVQVPGPYSGLPAAYEWTHGTWLPGSGEPEREAPSFEIYVRHPGSVPEAELLTEIYVPLG
jgi:AraC family transcriptional regulator